MAAIGQLSARCRTMTEAVIVQMWDRIVQQERERQEQLTAMGRTLRNSLHVPTDTYITGDIPTLLTRLGQVPAISERKMR